MVTEVPLSYSSVIVKVDTDIPIGQEGAAVYAGKREVGMVETEQYGSKMLHIGGVNRLTGPNGFAVARTITEHRQPQAGQAADRNGSRLVVQVGSRRLSTAAKWPKCGRLRQRHPGDFRAAPEGRGRRGGGAGCPHHGADEPPRGRHFRRRQAHRGGAEVQAEHAGRYFGDHGAGWGGTSITDPLKVIDHIDMTVGWPGMTVLITETPVRTAPFSKWVRTARWVKFP